MPGRTPYAAVRDYLLPIRGAIAILGDPVILHGRGQAYGLNDEQYWRLGPEDGLQLRMTRSGSSGYFLAEQRYQIVEVDPERFPDAVGRYRVSTRMYAYELRIDGIVEWQMHWHPQGNSPEFRPHNHLASRPAAHLPSGRHTIEDAVEWCVGYGAEPQVEDWEDRLRASKEAHETHRTWSDMTEEPKCDE